MKNLLTFILLTLILSSFQLSNEKVYTINELLANPKIFNGKVVSVTGYYVDEFENRSIYSSKKISKKFNDKSSIWLETFAKDIKFFDKNGNEKDQSFLYKKQVIVSGIFKCEPDTIYGVVYGYGHMSASAAELTEIISMQENGIKRMRKTADNKNIK